AVDAIASPAAFEFTAANARGTVHEGDELTAGGPVALRIRSNAPGSFTTIVWNGATAIAERHEPSFAIEAPDGPAVYRVEVRSADALLGAAQDRRRRRGSGAPAAIGVRRRQRSGAHRLLLRLLAGRVGARRSASARGDTQPPVRRRHDEHHAWRGGSHLDQEG